MQAARKLLHRAAREREGRFLVEGAIAVSEALAAASGVRALFVSRDRVELEPLASRAAARGVPVFDVPPRVADALSSASTPQGVVAVVEAPTVELTDVAGEASLVVVLADVRDPGNAGTLLRSAVAAGVRRVWAAKGTVDLFSPKVVRAGAGAPKRRWTTKTWSSR